VIDVTVRPFMLYLDPVAHWGARLLRVELLGAGTVRRIVYIRLACSSDRGSTSR
jgi:hypothetical protein